MYKTHTFQEHVIKQNDIAFEFIYYYKSHLVIIFFLNYFFSSAGSYKIAISMKKKNRQKFQLYPCHIRD